MKTILLTMACAIGFSFSAWGAPCLNEDLNFYDVPGFSCTFGGLTFSNFSYTPTGAIAPPATLVDVVPTAMGGEIGLEFVAGWDAGPGQIEDSLINYTATATDCGGCSIDDWVLQIAGAGSSGDGVVNVAETSAQVGTGLIQTSVGGVIMGTPSGTFSPVSSLSVAKDIFVYGGGVTNTNTQISSVTNLFSLTASTPEPSLLILCTGLLGLVPIARRKFVR